MSQKDTETATSVRAEHTIQPIWEGGRHASCVNVATIGISYLHDELRVTKTVSDFFRSEKRCERTLKNNLSVLDERRTLFRSPFCMTSPIRYLCHSAWAVTNVAGYCTPRRLRAEIQEEQRIGGKDTEQGASGRYWRYRELVVKVVDGSL